MKRALRSAQGVHAQSHLPEPNRIAYLCCNAQFKLHRSMEKDLTMTKRNPISRMLTTFGSAVAVARAVEAGRKPNARDLVNLGIEPVAFDNIRRF